MLVSGPLTIPKILGGKARGRKKVRMATKLDRYLCREPAVSKVQRESDKRAKGRTGKSMKRTFYKPLDLTAILHSKTPPQASVSHSRDRTRRIWLGPFRSTEELL
jgi:hypothetical protein